MVAVNQTDGPVELLTRLGKMFPCYAQGFNQPVEHLQLHACRPAIGVCAQQFFEDLDLFSEDRIGKVEN